MIQIRTALSALAVLSVLASCGDDQAAAKVDVAMGLPKMERPAGWSEARAELGKQLFFDTRLSSNAAMSCSTCHLHEHGWTDAKQFSTKVDGKVNTRNSPSLYNVGYQPLYYWDGRAPTMEANVAAAWKGHMGGDADKMAETLKGVDAYAKSFQAAFGTAPTGELIVDALCAFVRSLQAGGTRYDAFVAGDTKALDADEQAGMTLFMANCAVCHTAPLFTDMKFHNVGIGMDAEQPDLGRKAAKNAEPDAVEGAFKTPSLRAVGRTAPYFHDGSVATLEEAVRLMAHGGKANEHLDPILVNTLAKNPLDDSSIAKLVAFLKALDPREAFTAPKLP